MTKRFSSSVLNVSRIVLFVGVGLTATSHAKAYEATYAQRMACTPDAWRLCSDQIPDADAVKACMISKKSQLSPGCRAAFPKETASR